ncbi:MAG: sugar phosphate isomerase/epimerase [Promethearchaeota archaeon]|nr:MAG: sugar phosphate isomerase/epimerase [Candidatus Lokiarchaeota archaeon]
MNHSKRISVVTDEISQDFDYALDVAAEYGISTVDVRTVWNENIVFLSDDELERMQKALDQRNMQINVITSPFGKCVFPSSRFSTKRKKSLWRNPEFNLELFDRIVEISDFFKTPNIRIFSFFEKRKSKVDDKWEEMINLIKPYVKKAENIGKTLLLENDYMFMVADIEHTIRFFEDLNSDALQLILDPGNYYMEGDLTTREAYANFYERDLVNHIHVKDPKYMIPGITGIFTVVGKGKINYDSIFKQAIDYGYEGYFCLETHALRNKEQVSRKSLKYMIKTLREI